MIFLRRKKYRVVNQPKRCSNTRRGWNVLPFVFLKQGLYGRIIDSLCFESLFKKQDFTGFWLPIFLPDPSSVVCSVGSKVINFSISQGNDIRTDRKISFHEIFCVFFFRPKYFRYFVQPNVAFWPGHMESHWECLVAKGRTGAWESSQSQRPKISTFPDVSWHCYWMINHTSPRSKEYSMTMNMIIPILVHCSLFLDFEVYNAIRTYFNAYTLSFTKTAKQLWIRSLHKGPFGQAIKKSAWATDFSHTNLPGTPNNNFQ